MRIHVVVALSSFLASASVAIAQPAAPQPPPPEETAPQPPPPADPAPPPPPMTATEPTVPAKEPGIMEDAGLTLQAEVQSELQVLV